MYVEESIYIYRERPRLARPSPHSDPGLLNVRMVISHNSLGRRALQLQDMPGQQTAIYY